MRAEIEIDFARRVMRDIECSIPPLIADRDLPELSSNVSDMTREAMAAMPVSRTAGELGGIMEGILLRTEAINSSRIEGKRTNIRNLALAEAGAKSKPGALETLRNVNGLRSILKSPQHELNMVNVRDDHNQIMELELGQDAGRFRTGDEYVYIGGTNALNADHVAPPADMVDELMRDWIRFTSRKEENLIAQIAIAHCQFECIHPFINGNGRTGRAATQRMLLSRGKQPLPVSAGMFAMKENYYDTFSAYKEGNLDYVVNVHAVAFLSAATSMQENISSLDFILAKWRETTGARGQKNRNLGNALKWISQTPAFTRDALREALGISEDTAKRIINQMEEAEILSRSKDTEPRHGKYRQQIWEAKEIYLIAEDVEKSVGSYVRNSKPERYSDYSAAGLPSTVGEQSQTHDGVEAEATHGNGEANDILALKLLGEQVAELDGFYSKLPEEPDYTPGVLALSVNASKLEEMILDIGGLIVAADIPAPPTPKIGGRRYKTDKILERSINALEVLRKAIEQFRHDHEKETPSEEEMRHSASQVLQMFDDDINIDAVLDYKSKTA